MGYKPGRCLITDILHKKRKNQQWLSEESGIAKSLISEYARNKRLMTIGTAKTIATALNCHIDDLYDFFQD
ncbi:helix-turn-helix domain-containing protein [Paenibacillus sp. FSL K6-1217]|uniref:helix-turn-helix domain-containing protein n=1 Tax=Paenibacillus sp. FSL K6-1217 TaxID=2921466 RepID=UPI003868E5BD